ncbi:hypothetical protein BpHYR1_050948 [Brachionus plicatilis]|uniref:Uncharacterized protein n=1 Tax=Brachionus plicatilis TaxID=10195 RepID=A0A3M7QT32_BRAPC|nr:hypothetical protein BpHYR1_050948 [Brachionus plicatilis]
MVKKSIRSVYFCLRIQGYLHRLVLFIQTKLLYVVLFSIFEAFFVVIPWLVLSRLNISTT